MESQVPDVSMANKEGLGEDYCFNSGSFNAHGRVQTVSPVLILPRPQELLPSRTQMVPISPTQLVRDSAPNEEVRKQYLTVVRSVFPEFRKPVSSENEEPEQDRCTIVTDDGREILSTEDSVRIG